MVFKPRKPMLKLKINASMSDILFYKHFETTANISNQKQYKLIYIQCNCSLSHVLLFVTPQTVVPPGSSFHGTFQVKILEWVAISSSRRSSWPRDQTHISYIGRILYLPPCHLGSPYFIHSHVHVNPNLPIHFTLPSHTSFLFKLISIFNEKSRKVIKN